MARAVCRSAEPTTVTFEKPTHVSDYFIFRRIEGQLGVAIKRLEETAFRVQWFEPPDVDAARKTGMLFLERFEELPLLPKG